MERTNKKDNVFVRYFKNYGLKQVCDLIMLIGFILLITGLCTNDKVLLAGFITYCAAAAASVVLCVRIMLKTENHRDPVYKSTLINLVIMAVLFALALFGLIWTVAA